MFLGEYLLNFTGHSRIVLPKKFRTELKGGSEFILSRGLDGCIFGFDPKRWEEEVGKQLETPVTDEEGRNMRRYLFSAAEVVRLDEQGRFIIPSGLVTYAHLDNEVAMIGAGDHFEIWVPSLWQKKINHIVYEKTTGTDRKT